MPCIEQFLAGRQVLALGTKGVSCLGRLVGAQRFADSQPNETQAYGSRQTAKSLGCLLLRIGLGDGRNSTH